MQNHKLYFFTLVQIKMLHPGCCDSGSKYHSLLTSSIFPTTVSLERAIPFEHMMYEHLQKWGPRKQEVKFFLRHEDSPTESSEQGTYCHFLLSPLVAWGLEVRVVRMWHLSCLPDLCCCHSFQLGIANKHHRRSRLGSTGRRCKVCLK